MDRMPFGVAGLDGRIGGGAPAGSVVLLAGEPGAGAREFLYTTAAMMGLSLADEEAFEFYYGEEPGATVPEAVHYVTLSASEATVRDEMTLTMDEEIVDDGLSAVEFTDISREYFQLSPVPREWYAESTRGIDELGEATRRPDVIEALADVFDAYAPGNMLLVDSLTDLTSVHESGEHTWDDIIYLLKGLRRASRGWGGVILVHVALDALTDRQLGDLMTGVDGTMQFEWEVGGNERARTMVVREFRGVLSQLEAEDIIQFETEVDEAGFDISDVRKIR